MKLDINEVYHQYIIRLIIFALFTYKRQVRQPNIFKHSVMGFVNKRMPWKIHLDIIVERKYPLDKERDILLDDILNGIESDVLPVVTVTFTTPLKEMVMNIDLKDEKKYEQFLYK